MWADAVVHAYACVSLASLLRSLWVEVPSGWQQQAWHPVGNSGASWLARTQSARQLVAAAGILKVSAAIRVSSW